MNIAIITDTYFPDINGVTSSIYTLALALRKRGHRVYIFAISNIPKRSALGKAVAVAGIAMAAVSMVGQEYSRRILR